MLYWAMGASEAINWLEVSGVNKEFFSLVKELQRRVGVWGGGRGRGAGRGIDHWSKEHIKEWRSLEN